MRSNKLIFVLGGLALFAGCRSHDTGYVKIIPAKMKKDERGKFLILTPKAVERLGIVERAQAAGNAPIPLAALLYDPRGGASLFLREAPGVYRRRQVSVASQDSETFTVKENLAGLILVILGAAELSGAEEGVGK